ncbi:unnamed protein product, partial [Ectocarpus sp. 12 AP-2014]
VLLRRRRCGAGGSASPSSATPSKLRSTTMPSRSSSQDMLPSSSSLSPSSPSASSCLQLTAAARPLPPLVVLAPLGAEDDDRVRLPLPLLTLLLPLLLLLRVFVVDAAAWCAFTRREFRFDLRGAMGEGRRGACWDRRLELTEEDCWRVDTPTQLCSSLMSCRTRLRLEVLGAAAAAAASLVPPPPRDCGRILCAMVMSLVQ